MTKLATITHALAERHEALLLRLSALHKDLTSLAGKRAGLDVSDAIRITAEGLLSDCAPFADGERLPVVAPDVAGLLVQLGQARARLDAYEATHTFWNTSLKCRCWRVSQGEYPVQRLRPELPPPPTTSKGEDMRGKLNAMIKRRWQSAYEDGFKAGLSARKGPPEAVDAAQIPENFEQTYPRIRRFD